MNIKKIFDNQEAWLFVSIFLFFGVLYISQLTTVSLWYDEGIEYFYSKYMTGPIPISGSTWQTGGNMYERICMTFQPPLYNILMYFWLLLFDSEIGFRLAGVLTTFMGAIGFYFALRRMSNYKWGILGACIYLSTSVVFFYALECGEYNLLLCMECWTLYFFVECEQHPQGKASWKKLILFFLFAVLSVYSQYGAALFIISLFVALCYIYIKRREMVSLRRLFVVGFATFVIAIIPLLVFFLRIQLASQGTNAVDHSPVFVGSFLGGIPYSLFKSFYEQILYIFSTSLSWGWHSSHIMISMVATLFIIATVALFIKSKTSILVPLVIASAVGYAFFFVLSAFSFYAYNIWDGNLGCYNIIHQTRYILFWIPLLLFTLLIGVISVYNSIIHCRYNNLIKGYVIALSAIFIFNLAWSLKNCRIKSFDREVATAWLDRKDFDHKIVMHEFVAPTFLFYARHSSLYPEIRDLTIITSKDICSTERIESFLCNMKLTDFSSFYFIGNKNAPGMEKGVKLQLICNFLANNGYKVEYLFNKESVLLYISK